MSMCRVFSWGYLIDKGISWVKAMLQEWDHAIYRCEVAYCWQLLPLFHRAESTGIESNLSRVTHPWFGFCLCNSRVTALPLSTCLYGALVTGASNLPGHLQLRAWAHISSRRWSQRFCLYCRVLTHWGSHIIVSPFPRNSYLLV